MNQCERPLAIQSGVTNLKIFFFEKRSDPKKQHRDTFYFLLLFLDNCKFMGILYIN